jgi:H+/Cl- antiporter ClcA
MLVGAASGITAVLFFLGLEAASHFTFGLLAQNPLPSPPGDRLLTFEEPSGADPRRWVFFLLPVIGGLLSGLVVYRFAPETEGHGTDAVIKAFHQDRGMIRARVPLVKGIATIFTLASGGSAGKEGPIAQMGSGLASFMATKLGMNARDRRILLLTGMAGGLGAIFRAPLGSAITAIEVLYREDFESDAMIPCVISSVTAYVTFVLLLGSAQIFSVPGRPLIEPVELPGFLLLALIGVPVGRFYIGLFYGLRDRLFNRLPVPRYLLPMLGGLGVGLIGLGFPQAYGSGWGHIQKALDGELLIMTMAAVVIAKILATSMTIGSGGSGGVFGPTLFIGGMLGGAVGYGGHEVLPAFFPHPGAYVLVGMAAFFAGVASAPIGAMLMVAEMTGGYTLLPPLMLVSVVAIQPPRGDEGGRCVQAPRGNSDGPTRERLRSCPPPDPEHSRDHRSRRRRPWRPRGPGDGRADSGRHGRARNRSCRARRGYLRSGSQRAIRRRPVSRPRAVPNLGMPTDSGGGGDFRGRIGSDRWDVGLQGHDACLRARARPSEGVVAPLGEGSLLSRDHSCLEGVTPASSRRTTFSREWMRRE